MVDSLSQTQPIHSLIGIEKVVHFTTLSYQSMQVLVRMVRPSIG